MDGGTATTVETVITAITNMATTVADSGLSLIAQILPILAPVVAAIMIATLGYRLVKRFAA